jgi:hypothetical protein
MTQANDPRFSRPQPLPYTPQGNYPQQCSQPVPPSQGTVVMSRPPQGALAPEPATLVYRPKGSSSYPPPQVATSPASQQQMQMQQQMQQQGGHYSQRAPIQPYAQLSPQQAQSYSQPQYQQPQGAPSYAPQASPSYAPQASPSQPPHASPSYAPPPSQVPQIGFGFAGVPKIPGMDQAFGQIKGPVGMPSALAFGFGIVAVVVALVFDVIFLNVNVPGVGGYAWYLSTALSFAAAGFAGAKFTKATRSTALTAIGVAGALYGIADLGLGIALEHMPMGDALFLGVQGVAIAIFTGSGGVYKGLRARG